MTKASIGLQDLRRKIYVKAKAEPSWRFWGLYVHVCKMETLKGPMRWPRKTMVLREATGHLRGHRSAGGSTFPRAIQDELVQLTYVPLPAGRRKSRRTGQRPRPIDFRDPGSRGARGVQAHIGAGVRSGFPTGIVWISSQADRSSSGGPRGSRDCAGEDTHHRPRSTSYLEVSGMMELGRGGATNQDEGKCCIC